MRLRFVLFGVIVGIVFVVWAVISAWRSGDVNPLVAIIGVVFLTAATVNVFGILRARDRVSDDPTRSDPPDDDAA